MTKFGRAGWGPRPTCTAAILAAVLAGCGGGASIGMHDQQASRTVAVDEPHPAALAIAPFTENARTAHCTESRNRLFIIDGKQVFWDHAGRCADASYEQVLYGSTPENVLCTHGDTIAGPKTYCQDESARTLFETIVQHLDEPDLGLGAAHKVEQVAFLPKAGTVIPFESVARDGFSGVSAKQTVVIKDQAAWEKLWSQHGAGRTPAPELPQVDFGRQMLVGVFAGEFDNACHSVAISGVFAGASKLRVEVDERDISTFARCLPVLTHPMHVVAVERSDAEVEFVAVSGTDQAITTLDQRGNSLIAEERQVVVKDAAQWARLWREHAGTDAGLPQVDFGTSMVIGVFGGTRESACHATEVAAVVRGADKLRVRQVNTVPGPTVRCAMAITTPAHLVVTGRSDLPVEFAIELSPLGGSPR